MKTHRLLMALAGTVLLVGSGSARASELSNSVGMRAQSNAISTQGFTFSTKFKNSGVLPGAAGKLSGKSKQVGLVIGEQLTISFVSLNPSTAYQLVAFIGSNTTATVVTTFTSDAKGKFSTTYKKGNQISAKSTGMPLPDALSPLTSVRELDVLSAGATVLTGTVVPADKLVYQFKGPMVNTGAIPSAAATLQLKATLKSAQFKLQASGLPPNTDFLLSVNVSVIQKVTTDSKGKLNLKASPTGSPATLGIHTVALASNTTGTNVLVVKGLGVPPDNVAPSVVSSAPADTSTSVPTNTKISVAFNKAVVPTSFTTSNFTVTGPGNTPVSGTIFYDTTSNRAIFTPSAALATSTLFTAMLAAGIPDFSGNVLANNVTWTFTTGTISDTAAPFVISTNPANAATGVPINRPITATFNKTMDAATINSATFMIFQGSTQVAGSLTYSGSTATFTPTTNLALSTTFNGTITTAVTDLAGNEMASPFTWSFTTGAMASAGPAPVPLGAASSFGVLAGSTVTSVGPTKITGDLGVSPGTGVTGFPPGIVTGSIHAGDDAAAKAKNDLLVAYNDGASRLGAAVLPGNLGGLTFTPGLYKNSSSTMISGTGTNAIFTLDAQGDPNAVFIFQMGSTLTTDAGTQVVLSGGALAANVYWQVGSSATLGTSCIFKGNILADQSITLNTGATLDGRALTRVGAVALDSNSITAP
jgi:hypothetical protein